jgi:hypothetical protein
MRTCGQSPAWNALRPLENEAAQASAAALLFTIALPLRYVLAINTGGTKRDAIPRMALTPEEV